MLYVPSPTGLTNSQILLNEQELKSSETGSFGSAKISANTMLGKRINNPMNIIVFNMIFLIKPPMLVIFNIIKTL